MTRVYQPVAGGLATLHALLTDVTPNQHHAAFVQADHDGLANPHHSNANDHAAAHTLASHSTKAHSELSGVGADDHHAQAHTLTSHSTRAHSELTGIGSDDHHAKVHAHDGADGSGTTAHGSLTGVTADQHHAQAHHATHEPSGNDALLITSGSYTPGSMTVPDGTWMLAVDKIKLTTTQALIARGTAVVRGIGTAR